MLLLTGEGGAGKTRLLQQAMLEAQQRNFMVLSSCCYESSFQAGYFAFLRVLSQLRAVTPVDLQPRLTHVAESLDSLAEVPVQSKGSTETMTDHALRCAFGELLDAISESCPLALLIDDLHWADEKSLRLLRHLAQATRGSAVFIGMSVCDVEIARQHPEADQVLRELSHDRLLDRVPVRRLSLDETRDFIMLKMSATHISEEFASFAFRRSKGNPGLLDSLVRSLGGRLQLQEEIGAGSMGRVFRAYDAKTQSLVAAKLVLSRAGIEPQVLLRFQQEGAVLARLDHPNIVHVHDSFVEENVACIVMELIDGQPLSCLVDGRPLPLDLAKKIALQIADALSYAHSRSIVHRDIKPDNVVLQAEGRVKVTDFGIARLLPNDPLATPVTTTGMRLGTPLYMAPEQLEGGRVDGRSDVYGLGATLHHMITGNPPFDGPDVVAIAYQHLTADPPRPSSLLPVIPADWDELILKALAKQKERRFSSAREMRDAIEKLHDQPVRLGALRSRVHSKSLAGVAVAGLLAASILFATAVMLTRGSLHPASPAAIPRVDVRSAILGTADVNATSQWPSLSRGVMWLPNSSGNAVTRLSTAKLTVTGLTPLSHSLQGSVGDVNAVAANGNQVWAIHNDANEVVRINSASGDPTVVKRIGVGTRLRDIGLMGRFVWATSDRSDDLLRISSTGTVTRFNERLRYPVQLTTAGRSVWVSSGGSAIVRRIDGLTGRILHTIHLSGRPGAIAVGASGVWVADANRSFVWRINPATYSTRKIRWPPAWGSACCRGIAVDKSSVWVVVPRVRNLLRIDPAIGRVTEYLPLAKSVPIGLTARSLRPRSVLVGAGSVWVYADPQFVYQINAKMMGVGSVSN